MRDALMKWIGNEAPTLPCGSRRVQITDIPFELSVTKGGPLRGDGVYFYRLDPGDETLGDRLGDLLTGRHNKLEPLRPYRSAGKKALLLLETARLDVITLGRAFEKAFPTWPVGLDELWQIMENGDWFVSDLERGETWLFDANLRKIVAHNNDTFAVYKYGPEIYTQSLSTTHR